MSGEWISLKKFLGFYRVSVYVRHPQSLLCLSVTFMVFLCLSVTFMVSFYGFFMLYFSPFMF